MLVDERRHVDPVDHNPVDEQVDLDVDEPRMRDRDISEVHVPEPRTAQVGTPKHRCGEVTLEPLGHTHSFLHSTIERLGINTTPSRI